MKNLRLAVQLDPTNFKYIMNLGVVHRQKGSHDNAILCFEEASRVNPQASRPYYGLATILLEKNQLIRAHQLIQIAITLEGDNAAYHYVNGLIQLKIADYPSAGAAFKLAILLDETPAMMASNIGWAYHGSGLEHEAISNLREALRKDDIHTKSMVRLAWILATSSDSTVRNGSEALSLSQKVMKTTSTPSPELLDILAVSLAESGRFPEAYSALQMALAQSKDRQEKWVPDMEKRLALFEKGKPFHETVKEQLPSTAQTQSPKLRIPSA